MDVERIRTFSAVGKVSRTVLWGGNEGMSAKISRSTVDSSRREVSFP